MTRKISGITVLFGFLSICWLANSCSPVDRNSLHPEISDSDIRKGKDLAVVYCQRCHTLPDPSQLNVKSWENGVLPNMGPHLGIFRTERQIYPNSRNDKLLDSNYYPKKPVLSLDEWHEIVDYYIATAPDTLPGQKREEPIQNTLPFFKVQIPTLRYPTPTTCYIKVDTNSGIRSLLISDVVRKNITRLNSNLEPVDSLSNTGPVVDIDFQQKQMIACDMEIVNPNNGKFGKAERIVNNISGKMILDSKPFFVDLARPVQISSADLNKDGLTDYLICEFGNLTGALSWMQNLGNGQFDHKIISPVPGAIRAYIRDENHDGLPDLWVLFAQGDERISLFTNLGNGDFSERKVLRFPPNYGSSYFEFADFNHDGHEDIVYTCGDNADFSYVLKPYHGVYIFLNDGNNNFTQKYFFPMNGCFKAMARDFDGDGDLDIAAIAFFADYIHQPEEGFVYLENQGAFRFKPFSSPEAKSGRWLTMDVGDLDGDGKIDIVLGNFSIAPSFMKSATDWQKGPPFLFLKNTGK